MPAMKGNRTVVAHVNGEERRYFWMTVQERNEAVALNQELLEALKECLPYVGQTLANTGSMDAYYTEAKACAAINAAERNT